MKYFSSKSPLQEVLDASKATPFTVDELTQLYLDHPSALHTSKKAARQFVYRNMQRLMKVGHMVRIQADGRWPRYTLTPAFFSSVDTTVSKRKDVQQNLPKIDGLAGIKERLKIHQAEMLTAMGEMEEYEVICQEMPDLRELAQPRYNESRERCSRLLGRVKALESLLFPKAV